MQARIRVWVGGATDSQSGLFSAGWKQWRYLRTNARHMVQLGVDLEMANKHAISRKRYGRMSRVPAVRFAMAKNWLEKQGLISPKHLWD